MKHFDNMTMESRPGMVGDIPFDRLVKWEDDNDSSNGLSPKSRSVRTTKRDQDIEDILLQVQAFQQ